MISTDISRSLRSSSQQLVQSFYDRINCVTYFLKSCSAKSALISLLTRLLCDTLNRLESRFPFLKHSWAKGLI
ncbi:hypothetical protein PC39_15227 [Salinisphaera sp. PC39]